MAKNHSIKRGNWQNERQPIPIIDYPLAVTLGELSGHAVQRKFGKNPTVTTATDPEDVWGGGGLYTYDTNGTAPIVSIASSAAGDTQSTSILGLDVNGYEVSQTVTLTGTTRVALTTPLWRVYRVKNEGATDYAGNVFVYTGTGTVPSVGDSEVRAVVDSNDNQTLMAVYTIPRGKVGLLYRREAGVEYDPSGGAFAGTETVLLSFKTRNYGGVFQSKKDFTLMTSGNTTYCDALTIPEPIPDSTDIRIEVKEVTATMGIWAAFDILLLDEDWFSTAFLTSIGQRSTL